MALPKIAYVAELGWLGGNGGVAGTASLTATFSIPTGFEARLPVRAQQAANQSAGAEIRVYRGTPNGAVVDYETEYNVYGAFAYNDSGQLRDVIVLDTGYYAIACYSGGPNTASFYIGTQEVITAYE